MAVTASGVESLPLEHLKTILSNSSTFQTWTGHTGSASGAAGHIHYIAVTDDLGEDGATAVRPLAVIDFADDGFSTEAIAGGAGHAFTQEGTLNLYFENDVASGNSAVEREAFLAFMNNVGAIINEIANLSGTSTYLNIMSMARVHGPVRGAHEQKKDSDDFIEVAYTVDWSLL